jgi:hypothetical protein
MAEYAKLSFPSWSAKAELVDNVRESLPPEVLADYSENSAAHSLDHPGYIFRDGLNDIPHSFIITDDPKRWWSVLWTGEYVQADNLLDVAIDIWQSRLQKIY